MSYTCPDGHSSESGDYCDLCGLPIQGSTGAPAAPVGPPAARTAAGTPPPLPGGYVNPLDLGPAGPLGRAAVAPPAPATSELICPNCAASNVPGALYCENCGYDFTTGQLPRPLDPPAGITQADVVAALPADLAPPSGLVPPADAAPAPLDPATRATPPAGSTPAAGPATGSPTGSPAGSPASSPDRLEWVAEVWIDPDWYASQDVSDPCPSVGLPLVVPVRDRSVLIGRQSASRNIHPQIDLSSDNGVSRRHAQLTSDGQRWWVEDLQSANGTFVGAAGAAIPTIAIPVGQRVELADDDRIFVGAWTRVVVRRATPEEQTLGT